MDITKADSIAFAYTVKALGASDVTHTDYDPFFQKLLKFGITTEYKIPEKDKCGKLHFHGILYLKKGFFRKRIMLKGFHVKLVELYDRKGWYKYIHKDCLFNHFEEEAAGYDTDDTVISIPDHDFKMPTKSLFNNSK